MKTLSFALFSVAVACSVLLLVEAPVNGETSVRTQTVFGRGPELHLQPSYARLDAPVRAVGLGFRPGAKIQVFFGTPGAELITRHPLATTTVRPDGTFNTSIRLTCMSYRYASPTSPAQCVRGWGPLIVGAVADHRFVNKQTQDVGFVVMP